MELLIEPVLPLLVAPIFYLCGKLQILVLCVAKGHLPCVGLGSKTSIIGLFELMFFNLLHHVRLLCSFNANVKANLCKLLCCCPVLLKCGFFHVGKALLHWEGTSTGEELAHLLSPFSS